MKDFQKILLQLDSQAAHTSFGKLPLSTEKTAEQYGFPQAKKEDGAKIFINEDLAWTNMASKHSPGPIYDVRDDKLKYQKPPQWGFGTSTKLGAIKPKYDFYENERFLDDPIEADHAW